MSLFLGISLQAFAGINAAEVTQKSTEHQIHQLIDPLIERFCHDSCRILSIHATIGLADSDQLAPGFDEDLKSGSDLAASSAEVKLLIDDKIGPVTRRKLLDLLQQYLDSLDFPVHVDAQLAHFPLPQGSEGKINEMKDRISKSFQTTLKDLFHQFCPQTCLLADFNLDAEVVNGEETQYGLSGEFVQDGHTAIKIKEISATILMDHTLSSEEQVNILEMAKLKTNHYRHVNLTPKSMRFPQPMIIAAGETDPSRIAERIKEYYSSKNNNDSSTNETNNRNDSTNRSDSNNRSEKNSSKDSHSRIEKIERVESGDAVQAELQKFKVFGLIFTCAILALLIFIARSTLRASASPSAGSTLSRAAIAGMDLPPGYSGGASPFSTSSTSGSRADDSASLARKFEIERLYNELGTVYSQQPKVAKHVFAKVLTEEGVEATAACVHVFGENIVIEMLRDPTLQRDLAELLDFYSKNPMQLTDEEKLDLLRRLHNRTVAGKLSLMGSLSSNLFDFLSDMDALQVLELIRTESLTVKAIILTQCDPTKRAAIYAHFTQNIQMDLLTELTRIDYLPRDYIFNVAHALKRKRKDNPRLNTESLPGSEVLLSLLEQTNQLTQQSVIKTLELSNPESARIVKNKLVSLDTLRHLRDGQLLEVVLSLKYEELIQFLKGAPEEVRQAVLSRSPKDLVKELEEELGRLTTLSRETYHAAERKVINRMKIMANDGHINLFETNERMFSESLASRINGQFVGSSPLNSDANQASNPLGKVG